MLRRPTALVALLVGLGVMAIGFGSFARTSPVDAQTTTTESTTTTTAAPTTSTTAAPTTSTTAAPTTSTTVPQTTTTQRGTTTTQRANPTSSSSTSTSTSTSSTSTSVVPAVVPPGYNDPTAKGSSFWSTGRKLGAVMAMLVAIALGMAVLTFFYWRATRPVRVDVIPRSGGAGDGPGAGSGPGPSSGPPTGPVGPLDAMVVDALRPDPFTTRDDLGLA